MTQAAHTPGPWVHDEDCAGRILGPDGVAVCAVYGSMARAQEDDCNQRLIASAPDMLAALEEMAAVFGWQSPNANPAVDAAIAAARAAIAKAKGQA